MSILRDILGRTFQGGPLSKFIDENGSLFRVKDPSTVFLANVDMSREAYLARFCKRNKIPFFMPFIIEPKSGWIELLWPGTIIVSLDTDSRIADFQKEFGVRFLQKCGAPSFHAMKSIGVFNRFAESGIIIDEGAFRGKMVRIVKGPLTGFVPRSIRVVEDGSAEISLRLLGREVKAALPSGAFSIDLHLVSLDEAILGEGRIAGALDSKITEANSELVRYLQLHPEYMYQLAPQRFEDAIAEILADMGFEVQFTPRGGRDGGRDLFAVISLPIGRLLTVVECKRYSARNKIGSDIVERFIYTIDRKDNASCGLIATTSFFSGEAKAIEEKFKWRLKLRDFDGIREWLSQYGSWSSDGKSGLFLPKGRILPKIIPA
jgi:restriction endonuclease